MTAQEFVVLRPTTAEVLGGLGHATSSFRFRVIVSLNHYSYRLVLDWGISALGSAADIFSPLAWLLLTLQVKALAE